MRIEEKILAVIKNKKQKSFSVEFSYKLFSYDEYMRISLGLLNRDFLAKRGFKLVEIFMCFSSFVFSFVRISPKLKEIEI